MFLVSFSFFDQADVAAHLASAIATEASRGRACPSPNLAPGHLGNGAGGGVGGSGSSGQRVLSFLKECPCLSYPAVLRLKAHFRGKRVGQLLGMSRQDLDTACPWLSDQQRRNVLHYFNRAFEVDALAM